MRKVSHKIVNPRGLAEMLLKIWEQDEELSFATCYETDVDGEVLDQSTGDWWGMKFLGYFDGGCLLIGQCGGGAWYTYDTTTTPAIEELEDMMTNLFRAIAVSEQVCVEEVRWE